MSGVQGFFHLQSPRDLLGKLEHDFLRMQAAPLDSYAAFDFFVSAWHMLDWIHFDPADPKRSEQDRQAEVKSRAILRLCAHLANGSKHFKLTRGNHDEIRGHVARPSARLGEFTIGVSRLETEAGLELVLAPDEAHELGRTDWIDALDLAQLLIDYFRTHPGVK